MRKVLIAVSNSSRGRRIVQDAVSSAARQPASITLAVFPVARPWWMHLAWLYSDLSGGWECEWDSASHWKELLVLIPDDLEVSVREIHGVPWTETRRLAKSHHYDVIRIEHPRISLRDGLEFLRTVRAPLVKRVSRRSRPFLQP